MIKAIHYFSNVWPVNFWSGFHLERVKPEFKQIKRDGFNTIILILPWRGFQYDVEKDELNPEYLHRLHYLLKTAQDMNLKVMLRVSYPHYTCPYSIGAPRFRIERILREPIIKKSWFRFLSTIGDLCSAYSSFEYAFISWEDFWHIYTGFQNRPPELRKQIAKDIAYGTYISETVGLSTYNNICRGDGGHVQSADDIKIPVPQSPRYKFYLDFVNQQLKEILHQSRNCISPLIMEVRVDKDRYFDQDGTQHWYENDLQHQSELPRLTYWGPFIGAKNQGEKLSAEQTLSTLSHTLQEITNNRDNTRHIINQFNFIDETPAFKGIHAEIAEEQLPSFMNGAAKLLQQNSIGYGLWAYHDYCQNVLFNPTMARGELGWNSISNEVQFPNHRQRGQYLLLKEGAAVEQKFCFSERGIGALWLEKSRHLYFTLETYKTPFYRSTSISGLELRFNKQKPTSIEIDSKTGVIKGIFDITNITDAHKIYAFRINNNKGLAKISMVSLYFYEFKNHIYNSLGKPDKYRNLIVKFNKDLDTAGLEKNDG